MPVGCLLVVVVELLLFHGIVSLLLKYYITADHRQIRSSRPLLLDIEVAWAIVGLTLSERRALHSTRRILTANFIRLNLV